MDSWAEEQQGVLVTPLGTLVARWRGKALTALSLPRADRVSTAITATVPDWLAESLAAYFADPRHRFALSLAPTGTPFQQRVWQMLPSLAPGQVYTYGAVARMLGSGARAIGQACRANPCLIVVPCHRVVAVDGLGGFGGVTAGPQLAVKQWLLRHEAAC